MIVDHPDVANFDLTSLRSIMYGGSSITVALLDRARKALPSAGFVQAFGQTEASPTLTLLSRDDHDDASRPELLRSAGRAIGHTEVRIVDPEGNEVPRGEQGEIVGRGENVMLGYWNRPEETATALRNGWLHTGDAGRMDAQGYVYVLDRLKDMIITGGENVFSAEVENALVSHPEVAMCAVIGIPDELWGEAVHAVVVAKPGKAPTAAELIAHCKDRIAAYKCPKSVELREALPISGAGKVLKAELREPFWKGRTRRVA